MTSSLGNILTNMLYFGQVFKGKESQLILDWNRVRVFDKEVGQMFMNLAKTSREAQVFIIILFQKNVSVPATLHEG